MSGLWLQGISSSVQRSRSRIIGLCTWEQIGLRFGVSRQAAQQRFGPRMGDNLGDVDLRAKRKSGYAQQP